MLIKLERTNKVLTRFGGISLFNRAIRASEIEKAIAPHLPSKGFTGATRPVDKFLGLIYTFICGGDCLDDVEEFSRDVGFSAAVGKTISSQRYSEFLAKFDVRQLRELQDVLIKTSVAMREQISDFKEFHLCLDSTKHEQFGFHQEGVNWTYTDYKSLDSLHAHDDLGLPYWYSVRAGETHTADSAEEVLTAVLKELPTKCKKRYVLADSGFYSKDFFNTCKGKAHFIVAMRSNVYAPLLDRGLNWHAAPKKLKFFDGREFEFAETVYHPVDCKLTLRVVLVRALKRDHNSGLFRNRDYDYAAFATDLGQHELKAIDVIKKYRKRSHEENFIREMKNGINTRRFQCRRLVANGALALAAAFAHAFIRFTAHIFDKNLVHFAKRLRNKLLFLPAQVVRHGREVVFRYSHLHYEEVNRWTQNYIKLRSNIFGAKASPPDF